MSKNGSSIAIAILFSWAVVGFSEQAPSAGANSGGGAPGAKPGGVSVLNPGGSTGQVPNINPGTIKPLDDDFFSPQPGSFGQAVPGLSPKGREFDDMPDYNLEQRDTWLRKCSNYKEQDSKLYRECFYREKEKMQLELREKFDAVERRQGGGRKSLEDLLQPEKSSGGFD